MGKKYCPYCKSEQIVEPLGFLAIQLVDDSRIVEYQCTNCCRIIRERKGGKYEKIAITPHVTRGEEVIKILESLGGVNADRHKGNLPIEWKSAYYIYGDCTIQFARIEFLEKLNYKIYTLEEYEQREL